MADFLGFSISSSNLLISVKLPDEETLKKGIIALGLLVIIDRFNLDELSEILFLSLLNERINPFCRFHPPAPLRVDESFFDVLVVRISR